MMIIKVAERGRAD